MPVLNANKVQNLLCRDWRCAPEVECLVCKCEVLSSNASPNKNTTYIVESLKLRVFVAFTGIYILLLSEQRTCYKKYSTAFTLLFFPLRQVLTMLPRLLKFLGSSNSPTLVSQVSGTINYSYVPLCWPLFHFFFFFGGIWTPGLNTW
jgi:hypothetical protein